MGECELLAVWVAAVYLNLCLPSWSSGILYIGVPKLQNHLGGPLKSGSLRAWQFDRDCVCAHVDKHMCVREIMDKR